MSNPIRQPSLQSDSPIAPALRSDRKGVEAARAVQPPRVRDVADTKSGPRSRAVARDPLKAARDIVLKEWDSLRQRSKTLNVEEGDEECDYDSDDDAEERDVIADRNGCASCLRMLEAMSRGESASRILHDDEDGAGYSYAISLEGVAEVFAGYFDGIDWEREAREALQLLESKRPLGWPEDAGQAHGGPESKLPVALFCDASLTVEQLPKAHRTQIAAVQAGDTRGCELVDGLPLNIYLLADSIHCPAAAEDLIRMAHVMRRMGLAKPLPPSFRPLGPLLIDPIQDRAEPSLERLEPDAQRPAPASDAQRAVEDFVKRPQLVGALATLRKALADRNAGQLREALGDLRSFQGVPQFLRQVRATACEELARALACMEAGAKPPDSAAGSALKRKRQD